MSEIRVNNIIADNGLDAVNFSKGINISSGVCTATSFSGSGANFKLPQSDGSAGQVLQTDGNGNLSWVTPGTATTNGITMADRWGITGNTNLTNANTYYNITANWQKSTAAGSNTGSIGSAMTESGGLFTFPSTGIYYIVYDCITGTSNDQLNMWSYIATGANLSDVNHLSVKASSGDSGTMNTVTGSAMLDVTNTSTQKIFVRAYAASTGCYVSGNSNSQRTCLTFIRLGDT